MMSDEIAELRFYIKCQDVREKNQLKISTFRFNNIAHLADFMCSCAGNGLAILDTHIACLDGELLFCSNQVAEKDATITPQDINYAKDGWEQLSAWQSLQDTMADDKSI